MKQITLEFINLCLAYCKAERANNSICKKYDLSYIDGYAGERSYGFADFVSMLEFEDDEISSLEKIQWYMEDFTSTGYLNPLYNDYFLPFFKDKIG
jgi:hypothetical protein